MSSPLARPVSQFAIVLVATGLLAACAHEPARQPPHAGDDLPRRSTGEQAAMIAVRQLGVPYRYGGSTIAGFDCSGLTQFSYAGAGRRIPRTTAGQWRELLPVPAHDLRVGDVLFFRIGGRIAHVGMYLGRGRFVHSPSNGRAVSIERLSSDFYREAFVRGGRPQ